MPFTRRRLLTASLAVPLLGSARASSTQLGIDSYTLRSFGWKAFEMLDYAASMKLGVVQFSEWPHIGSYEQVQDESYLKRVREHADNHGVAIEMGTWGVCPTNPRSQRNFDRYGPPEDQLRLSIRIAKVLGSKTIRCVMGSGHLRREDGPVEKHIEAMISLVRGLKDDALEAGVKIAPENHKDMRASEMRTLVEEAGTDVCGAIIDTGNPMEVLEDPMETVEVLAPVAVGSHFRDSVLWKHPRGAAFQWTAMGDGSVRIGEVVRRYVELCPDLPVILEIITGRPPAVLAYHDPEFMRAFPNLSGEDVSRFDRLARRGHPLMTGMIIPHGAPDNPAYREAVREQQRVDFERSIRFLRDEIGL